MASFNKVILLGNLTRDPQTKNIGQTTLAEFGLAVNRKFKTGAGEDREEVLFVDCTAWGKQAETINQYCRKGSQLLVEGRLKYDAWEDKQGGGKRSRLTVVVEGFQFTGSRGADSGQGSQPAENRARNSDAVLPKPKPADEQPPISQEQIFKKDDIPF